VLCNVVVPQALWSANVRASTLSLFVIAIVVNIGMWLERFMIIVSSLNRDFLPSSWHIYVPTFWDLATLAGSIGAFALLFLLFVRVLPAISIAEMRKLAREKEGARA
jgi:molybdopterin-containing oxidoreductase family membrane subunit